MGKDASPIHVGSLTFDRTLQHTAATYISRTMDTFLDESCAKAPHMYAVHLTVHDDPDWRYKNAVRLYVQIVSRESESGRYKRAECQRDLVSLVPAPPPPLPAPPSHG